jgi:hypothetical protein
MRLATLRRTPLQSGSIVTGPTKGTSRSLVLYVVAEDLVIQSRAADLVKVLEATLIALSNPAFRTHPLTNDDKHL